MATPRLSRLHKPILQWLAADHQQTTGFILSGHEELVKVHGNHSCETGHWAS
jgi:hypothetical protein